MNFVLTYRGVIPRHRGNAIRHTIREQFSDQLRYHWQNEPVLAAKLANGQAWAHAIVDPKSKKQSWMVPKDRYATAVLWAFGYRMIPLVTRHNGLGLA